MKKLEGHEKRLADILVRVSQTTGNFDHLITEALQLLKLARQLGRDEAVDYIEEHSLVGEDLKSIMIIHDDARALPYE